MWERCLIIGLVVFLVFPSIATEEAKWKNKTGCVRARWLLTKCIRFRVDLPASFSIMKFPVVATNPTKFVFASRITAGHMIAAFVLFDRSFALRIACENRNRMNEKNIRCSQELQR
jgi:hypothetical protein